MKFLQQLLDESRLLTILFDNLPLEIKESALYRDVAAYLEEYAFYNNITATDAVAVYTNYISTFNRHCKQFVTIQKYPAELDQNDFSVSREEYDVVLMLSILFTRHRYRIMELLETRVEQAEKALYIGLGSGFEIALTGKACHEIHAYDLSVNSFLFSRFPEIQLNIELYNGQFSNYFDAIFMIELLEHLPNPFELLNTCFASLKKGGKIYLTTATDIPQFDHLYNFAADHSEFEEKLKELGFSIEYKEMIPHQYLSMELKPSNHFYIIQKV